MRNAKHDTRGLNGLADSRGPVRKPKLMLRGAEDWT